MAGRIYIVTLTPTAVFAALDALELVPASNFPVIIHKVVLTPTASETNQQILVTGRILPATFTSGSTGATAPSVGPTNTHLTTTSSFTVENFNTVRATTSGTAIYQFYEGFASQGGFEYNPNEDERPTVYSGQGFIVGVEESMAGAMLGGYAIVEEL